MLERAMNLDIRVHNYIIMGSEDARNSNNDRRKKSENKKI